MMKLFNALIASLTLLGALSAWSVALAETSDGASIVEQNNTEKARLDRAGFPQYVP